MNVIVPVIARWDALDAADEYESQVRGLGQRFLLAVDDAVRKIAAQPRAYSPAPNVPVGRDIRFRRVNRFSYLIYYEVTSAEVIILAVVHARRSQRVWRRRL
jgi:plasmid stabilization system protein ParE